jgi:predicted nucleic acid-binding protein
MATSIRRIFVDTNILVYATVVTAPLHQRAQQTLQTLWNSGDDLWLSRQVLREYAMVVTRPQSFMQPLTPSIAANHVQRFVGQFQIADDTPTVTTQWLTLLQTLTIAGRQVYDANIVATMLAFGVTHLLTNNPSDFTRYGQRITVVPL